MSEWLARELVTACMGWIAWGFTTALWAFSILLLIVAQTRPYKARARAVCRHGRVFKVHCNDCQIAGCCDCREQSA